MSALTAEMIERGPGIDPAVAVERRRASRELRAVRERLTSTSGFARAFDYELVRLYAQQRSGAALAMGLLASCIAVVAGVWLPVAMVAGWLALVFLATATSLVSGRHFLGLPQERVVIGVWRRRFVLCDALQGVTWAMLVVILLAVPDEQAKLFVFVTVLIVSAVTAMFSSSIPWTVAAGLVPMGVVTAASSLPFLGGLGTLMMMAVGVSTQLYFGLLAVRQYKGTVATLEFRAEKDALIAELEQAKANSDEARRRAEDANLAKSRFLATMSHELRTPLNAILGFSEVMKEEVLGPLQNQSYREYAGDIHASGRHLLNLIDEILDLSRIEAGRYELSEEALLLADVVEESRHLLGLRAKGRNLSISLHVEPGLPKVWADERAMRQIALNLLSNAIKFTQPGGEVTLRVGWTTRGGQYLSVRDNGPGIPEEEIPIVLASFGRGSLAIKTAEQGSGLGLPIVKGLIELHGGTLTLTSTLREGTDVIVALPPGRVVEALSPIDPGARSRA